MRVWDRKKCSRLYPPIRRIDGVWSGAEAGTHRSGLWQMDSSRSCSKKTTSDPMVGLSLRLRNRARGRAVEPNDRNLGFLRVHDWHSCKETFDQARSCLKQDILGLGVYAAALQQSEQPCVPELRRPRDRSIARLADFRGFRKRYGSDLPTRIDSRSPRCEWQLRGDQLYLGATLRTGKEQTSLFGVETE